MGMSPFSGNLDDLIRKAKREENGHIFIDGGAETVHALLTQNLIEEMVISVIPVLLGGGIRLFQEGRPEAKLQLVSSETFPSGLVQLRYECLAG